MPKTQYPLSPTKVTPFLVGHGRSAQAVTDAIGLLASRMPHVDFQKPIHLARDESLKPANDGKSVAFICNPHGLHTEKILEASKAGFDAIASEKPACVSLAQALLLEGIRTPCAVFHVYRVMWGLQTLREMIVEGAFGDLIAIEGRYWQSSTAERALSGPSPGAWKNKMSLSGPSDVLLDIGTHWVDAAAFLAGHPPKSIEGWASYANAESAHRDSHIHLSLQFEGDLRGLSSISKTVHGASNHFEINVIGTKRSASWTFLNPDEIAIGEGRSRRVVIRDSSSFGSGHPAYHATGWLEGYTEIIRELMNDVVGHEGAKAEPKSPSAKEIAPRQTYPSLNESVRLVKQLLESGILTISKSVIKSMN